MSLLLVGTIAATAGAQATGRSSDADVPRSAPQVLDGVRAAPVAARRPLPADEPRSAPRRADDVGSSRSHYTLVGSFIGFGLAGLILAMDPPTKGMSAAIILPGAAVVGGIAGAVVHAFRY